MLITVIISLTINILEMYYLIFKVLLENMLQPPPPVSTPFLSYTFNAPVECNCRAKPAILMGTHTPTS